MRIDLPKTTISKVSKTLVTIREEGGLVALGRVLTLIIKTNQRGEEEAIAAANDASYEHPMRVLVVSTPDLTDEELSSTKPRLDAEIRVGGDAGASEVIVLRAFGEVALNEESLVTGLLLPDAPVVVWWPGKTPESPAQTSLGKIAQRRITDSANQVDPRASLQQLLDCYTPGDTDFAWTRLTQWRAQLAAVLDQPPYRPVTSAIVAGPLQSPSTVLLASWLKLQLQVPVEIELVQGTATTGISGVTLNRDSGDITLIRDLPAVATLTQPGQPTHTITLPRRSLRDCLAEELRRLDTDELYGRVLTHGVALIEGD